MSKKTILAIDDTASNLDTIIELLSDYDVIDVTSASDGFEILEEEEVNLILLDIVMPDMDGYEMCEKLKANIETKDIPIIFITAKTDEDSIEKAFDMGGSDYVKKPFHPKELLARVKKELTLQELQAELQQSALTDPLTELHNRRYFNQITERLMELSKRNNEPLSVVILDIDLFKSVNDTYGHQVGDEVIKVLANRLKKYQRKSDIACRLGGDEFILLLPNTTVDGAEYVANKIRESVNETVIETNEGDSVTFSISLGVSEANKGMNLKDTIRKADESLYEAKKHGRNCVVVL